MKKKQTDTVNVNIQKRIFHIISNTHWDREWRFPFQRNRQFLVEMIDEVLRILSVHPEYRAFHLDSQSIVLDDYIAVKPQNKKIIMKFIKEKRLFVGPWYILPDEFLVGGENLIRNLLLGHHTSKKYGRTSKIGYSPFSWGQISQLPQIYREFDINLIMFYRGINSLDSHNAEFIWEGADGTQSLASRFSTMPRYNFYFYIYRPVLFNEKVGDVKYKWSKGAVPFHFASKELSDEDYFIAHAPEEFYEKNIAPSVNAIVEKQADDFTTPHVIWMEGHDSSGPNYKTPDIIQRIRKQFPRMKVLHSTLEDYAKCLSESVDVNNLRIVKGERRSAQYDQWSGNLYGYVTSARMYLKQKNFEAEKWLQYYAEPWYQLAEISGLETDDQYLSLAWNYLIQNSAHDSIGGCSLDDVHNDMMYRYDQVIHIARGCYSRALKYFVKNIDLRGFKVGSKIEKSNIFITIFNSLQYSRSETIEIETDIPKEFDRGSLEIRNDSGEESPMVILSKKECQPILEQLTDRPMYFDMMRYKIRLLVENIPPVGYNTYQVIPAAKKRVRKNTLMRPIKYEFENEYYSLRINVNGTFNLLNRKTGKEFKNLGYFYDEGEAGHAWVHTKATPVVTTRKSHPFISVIESNELATVISIKHEIQIPYNRLDGGKKKSVIDVSLFITLEKISQVIKLRVVVSNTAINHRLRMMFPTGIKSNEHFAEGQFDVVRRSSLRPDTSDWIEQPMYDFPAHHYLGVEDKQNGFSIFPNGLKEYEILNDRSGTIALTLLRAFTHKIQPSSIEDYSHQLGSQCLGSSEYSIGLFAYCGRNEHNKAMEKSLCFSYPMTAVQTGRGTGNLPHRFSFFEAEHNRLVFSCFKKAENGKGFILRLFNPSNDNCTEKITFRIKVAKAELVTLEEKAIHRLPLKSNTLSITAGAKKIITLRFSFGTQHRKPPIR